MAETAEQMNADRSDATADQRRASETVKRLADQLRTTLLGNPLVVAAFVAVYHDIIAVGLLVAWVLYSQIVNWSSFAWVHIFRKRNPFSVVVSGRIFLTFALLDGLTWAAIAWIAFRGDLPLYNFFLCGVLLGVAAAAQVAYAIMLPAAIVFTGVTMISLGLSMLNEGGFIYTVLAGLVVVYLLVVLDLARRYHAILISSWNDQFALERSQAELHASHDLLAQRVEDRTQELRLSETLYRAVVDQQTELICRWSDQAGFTFANVAFRTFFDIPGGAGVDLNTAVPSPVNGLDTLFKGAFERLRASRDLKAAQWHELEVRRFDGENRWMSCSVRAVAIDEAAGSFEFQIVWTDITDRKSAEQRIQFLAHHDPLTGLPNRLLLQDRLEHASTRAAREKEQAAIFIIDLDNFKNINDTLGHAAGDALLKVVAERLTETLRDSDTLARLGGDEFAVLQERVDRQEQVEYLAHRLLECLREPAMIHGQEVQARCSIGISIFPVESGEAGEAMVNADLALYHAKAKGRNNYQFYSDKLGQTARRRIDVAARLREAIQNDQLTMVYQPKQRLADGRLVGCESLVRWITPDQDSISPAEFIPIAERTGQINEIGNWVLARVCRQIKAWRSVGLEIPVAVNISALQFRSPGLVDRIRAILATHDVPAKLLEIEITETALMEKPGLTADVLQHLSSLGCKISIDDFGTGYSSLIYLQRLPVDKLKIDRAFIKNVTDSPEDQIIARAVIHLGQDLGLTVIAEGVETTDQAAEIGSMGCDEMQGYLLAKPGDPEEMEALWRLRLTQPGKQYGPVA